ncbi:hypothetical protein ABGN05_29335 [Aquibium sp. LZ166]|uniref:Uncharacterized protein n=1 Tax=Aquibium pacificus TaxID=3153579 RepID=A0ABV3SSH4_9HYPH
MIVYFDALMQSDLFDREWYLKKYPDVAATGVDPIVHYLQHGAKEGRDPGPLFDTRWYLEEYPDASKVNPLIDHITRGQALGRQTKASPQVENVSIEEQAEIVRDSDLFDREWYLKKYPDVAASGANPIMHYLRHGAKEGRDPGPLFDTRWYMKEYPDASKVNPLIDHIMRGQALGRHTKASAQVENVFIEEQAEIVRDSDLFDREWYLKKYPDVAATGVDPIVHYLQHGAKEGRDPGPLFDTRWYLEEYPDASKVNPLIDHISRGQALGRQTKASPQVENVSIEEQAEIVRDSDLFDREWYLKKYPDVAASGANPIMHYLRHGAKGGRDPGPLFDTRWYLEEYPDASKVNPLIDHITRGQALGRQTKASPQVENLSAEEQAAIIRKSDLFDREWYLKKYPDVAASGANPIMHYLRHGAKEGRDPGPFFATNWYQKVHSDVDASKVNPLVDHIMRGQALGRQTKPSMPPPIQKGGLSHSEGRHRLPLSDSTINEVSPIPHAFREIASLPPSTGALPELEIAHGFPIIPSPPVVGPNGVVPKQDFSPRSPRRGTLLMANEVDVLCIPEGATLERYAAILDAFAQLSGTTSQGLFTVNSAADRTWPVPASDMPDLTAPAFAAGPRQIRDFWFTSTLSLVVSLGDENESIATPGEAVRAYQCELSNPPRLRRVGTGRLSGYSPSFVEIVLDNPWQPVLLELSDPAENTLALCVLSFPSLGRGGMHYAEFLAASEGIGNFEHLSRYMEARANEMLALNPAHRLPRIRFRLAGASGAELGMQQSTLVWLRSLGFQVEAFLSGERSDPDRLHATGLDVLANEWEDAPGLNLPADGLPTIAALSGAAFAAESPVGGAMTRFAPYLVADEGTGRPRLSVFLPDDPGLIELQSDAAPSDFPDVTAMPRAIAPVCIRFRPRGDKNLVAEVLPIPITREPPLLSACADRAPTETFCLFQATNPEQTNRFLASLTAQEGVKGLSLVALPASNLSVGDREALRVVIDRYAPDRYKIWPTSLVRGLEVSQLLQFAGTHDAIFLASDSVILHDYRTLYTLQQLLTVESTASAACVLMYEGVGAKMTAVSQAEAGYFPHRIGLAGGPHLVLGARNDVLEAMPNSTFPVMANTLSATLLSRRALEETKLARLEAASFGLASARLGYRNLCTSVVRGSTIRRPTAAEVMDPLGFRAVTPAQWLDLLSRVTLIEELR